MPIILIIVMAASGFLLFGSMPEFVLTAMTPLLLMYSIALIALFMVARHIPRSIEINGDILSITTPNNEMLSDQIENIAYTDHAICIKHEYFNIGNKGALLKDRSGYKKMMSLLGKAEKLDFWSYQKRTYKNDMISNVLMIVLFILLLAFQATITADEDTTREKDILTEVIAS